MKRSSHYIAQQIKELVGHLDRHVLYPVRSEQSQARLGAYLNEYNTRARRLSHVLHVHQNVVDELVRQCLFLGSQWGCMIPFSEEDALELEEEHNETLPILEGKTLREVIYTIWDWGLPYGRQFWMPSTRDVMNLVSPH